MSVADAVITPELRALRNLFVERGFDLRFVGGCVRDLLCGATPKDIDLCTDATPLEQLWLYNDHEIDHYETGLQHGTLTVNLGEGQVYEITSLRTETAHDGRHAECEWTTDWVADLGRRDLTINAMALTFDNQILDPFDGRRDLEARRVRFVGHSGERIVEDYLRMLRFIRFHARFAGDAPFDEQAEFSLIGLAQGLLEISRERIWMEVSKIISGPHGPEMIRRMYMFGLAGWCSLGHSMNAAPLVLAHRYTKNPVTLMAALCEHSIERVAQELKWSTQERQLGKFLTGTSPLTKGRIKYLLAVHRVPVEHVQEQALMHGQPEMADYAKLWPIPQFPVTGHDLMEAGVAKGPALGEAIARLKDTWASSGYTADKESLLTSWEFT